MWLALLMALTMVTGSGPMDAALSATEAPRTLRAAFTVELQSDRARRVYAFDPRKQGAERWQVVDWQGDDDELEEVAANWAAESAPDGRLFPDDLRASLGRSVEVNDAGHAWQISFRHTPSKNDGEFDVWAAQRLQATAWLDPVGERFLRIDYRLPKPVAGPEGGTLSQYNQSYFLRTEPRWGMSYVSGFSIELEARAAFRKIERRYSANIVKVDFFFASAEAQKAFEDDRAAKPQLMTGLSGPAR
ncbi:MAG: hypothetical protein KJ871_12520 [Alphaproteobacteria bacterium]|nr:hypothetical protein [Alphaproteobacteria bacterium]MBU2083964.1 hypothetical protein [Alphaproteobacteria bacterium]MBU2142628.1 hypothetical protein [Alphaproteobacteria bacterium]MBU2196241.1 hypothetical protein [Alphaproteobacteria bacterium]